MILFLTVLAVLTVWAILEAYKPVTAVDYSVLNTTYYKLANPAHIAASDVVNMVVAIPAYEILNILNLNTNNKVA